MRGLARHGAALLAAAGLLATGCAPAPARRPPAAGIEPPQRWSARPGTPQGSPEADGPPPPAAGELPPPAAATPEAAWWTTFGDPALVAVVERTLRANHDLRAAAARVERALAAARIAGADLAPQVDVGLDAQRQRQVFVGLPIPGTEGEVLSSTSTRFSLSAGARWEADLWGRLRAAERAALAEVQATRADLAGAGLSLAAMAARTWYAAVEARLQLQLATQAAERSRETVRFVRERYELGLRPPLDLRLALSNLHDATARAELRRRTLDATVRSLETLAGGYPDGDLLEAWPDADFPPRLPPVPAGLPAELVARRPDLVAAERRLAAADQRWVAARRALYPRFALTASGGTVSKSLGDLLDGDFRVWSLLGSLTQPLFQGGRLRAQVDHAGADAEVALAGYATSVLEAFAEVESALAAQAILARRERALAERAAQLHGALELALERYRSGVGGFLEVLESDTRALNADSELLAARRQRLDNRIDLYLALGGGFEAAGELAAADGDTP